jgi:hypothetical protein
MGEGDKNLLQMWRSIGKLVVVSQQKRLSILELRAWSAEY